MDCTDFLVRYSDYDDSLIPPSEAELFRAHMAECGDCARYDRVLRKGRMLARQIQVPEPSEEFQRRLQLRLWGEASHSADRGRRSSRLAAGLAAVTVLAATAAGLSLMEGASAERFAAAPALEPEAVASAPARSAGVYQGAVLLAAGTSSPRPWTAQRVDHTVTGSYSPLVTGPPAFRSGYPALEGSFTLRR